MVGSVSPASLPCAVASDRAVQVSRESLLLVTELKFPAHVRCHFTVGALFATCD